MAVADDNAMQRIFHIVVRTAADDMTDGKSACPQLLSKHLDRLLSTVAIDFCLTFRTRAKGSPTTTWPKAQIWSTAP